MNYFEKLKDSVNSEPVLPDSGERRGFESGAVRDVETGKGVPSLMPWDALLRLAQHFEDGAIKYGGPDATNDYRSNWELGMPITAFFNSMIRHAAKFRLGHTDEPHIVSMCWNAICMLATVLRVKNGDLPESLIDVPGGIDSIEV